jgi:hypothetical protein
MCVIPPDGAVRIWADAGRFADGLLHAFHVSPGHALLKVIRVIPVSVREQCDQRDNTKAHTIADDENDAHLANAVHHWRRANGVHCGTKENPAVQWMCPG